MAVLWILWHHLLSCWWNHLKLLCFSSYSFLVERRIKSVSWQLKPSRTLSALKKLMQVPWGKPLTSLIHMYGRKMYSKGEWGKHWCNSYIVWWNIWILFVLIQQIIYTNHLQILQLMGHGCVLMQPQPNMPSVQL